MNLKREQIINCAVELYLESKRHRSLSARPAKRQRLDKEKTGENLSVDGTGRSSGEESRSDSKNESNDMDTTVNLIVNKINISE